MNGIEILEKDFSKRTFSLQWKGFLLENFMPFMRRAFVVEFDAFYEKGFSVRKIMRSMQNM